MLVARFHRLGRQLLLVVGDQREQSLLLRHVAQPIPCEQSDDRGEPGKVLWCEEHMADGGMKCARPTARWVGHCLSTFREAPLTSSACQQPNTDRSSWPTTTPTSERSTPICSRTPAIR